MWHYLASSMFATSASPSGGMECSITLPRRPSPIAAFDARIIPAPDDSGVSLVWQDGENIVLQRYTRDCTSSGPIFEVNRSRDFWAQPAGSGLSEAVGITGGATAVVWTLGGSVWTRVVRVDGSRTPVVRASGPEHYERFEVRAVASPPDGGYVLTWSSWGQDGDGWGVFARPFDHAGNPLGEEQQMNVRWQHFQWQPQLTWCGDTLWGLWANGTGGACVGDGRECNTGPVVRPLTRRGSWSPGEEVNLHGDGPIASTLACSGERGDISEMVAIVWLQHHGTEVRWEYLHSQSGVHRPTRLFSRRLQADDDLLASRGAPQEELNITAGGINHSMATEGAAGVPAGKTARRLGALLDASGSSAIGAGDIDAGQVQMLAHGGLLMLLTSDKSGGLSAQLMSYGASLRPVALPRRLLADGVRMSRAVWDPARAQDLALITCWVSGGAFEANNPSVFVCTRHGVWWFVGSYITPSIGSVLAFSSVLSLLYVCCCVGRCSPVLFLCHWSTTFLDGGRRSVPLPVRRLSARRVRLRRLREVREQLAQIPGTMARSVRRRDDDQGEAERDDSGPLCEDGDVEGEVASRHTGEEDSDAASERGRALLSSGSHDSCPICQEEVTVWVALRPCGHTACKDCILRLTERNQKCHICRGLIKGVQPVYI